MKYKIKERAYYYFKNINPLDSSLRLFEKYDSNGCITIKKEFGVYTKENSFRISFYENNLLGNRTKEREFNSLSTSFVTEGVFEYKNDSMVLYKYRFCENNSDKEYRIIKRRNFVKKPLRVEYDSLERRKMEYYSEGEQYFFKYYDSGKYSMDLIMTNFNDDHSVRFFYDKYGRNIEYHSLKFRKNKYFEHYKYTYNHYGEITSKTRLDYKGKIITKSIFHYDANGLIHKISIHNKKNELIAFNKYLYKFY